MSELWYPKGVPNRAPSTRWLAITGGPAKGVLHTTESYNFVPQSTYYGTQSWPHCTLAGDGTIYNHIPVNWGAPTLVNRPGGVQTNTDGAVQIEICWRADNIHALPLHMKDALRDWMRWVEAVRGVKRSAVSFVGPEVSPARVDAPQRMSYAQWDSYDGWCGHQHVPENEHWDPGHIDIAYLIGGGQAPPSNEEFLVGLTQTQQNNLINQVTNLHQHLLEITGDASIVRQWVRNIVREELQASDLKFLAFLDSEGVVDLDNDGVPG